MLIKENINSLAVKLSYSSMKYKFTKFLKYIVFVFLLMPHASYAKVDKDVNVAKVQAMLAELCYEPGIVDGAWGRRLKLLLKRSSQNTTENMMVILTLMMPILS